jgi:O-antigen/teichoic acid export membrane protein
MTSVLGTAFWSLVARLYPAKQVGIGSAAISSMSVLGTVGMLGLGTLLMTKLPEMPDARGRALLRASLVWVALASGVLGLGWAAASHWLSATVRPIGAGPTSVLIFVGGVLLFGVTSTLDYALLAAAGGLVQFLRNLVASIVKVVAIPLFAYAGMTAGMTIYWAWAIGMAVSLPVCYRQLTQVPARRRKSGHQMLRGMWRDAAGHHVLNLALQIPTLVLPVLAALVTSSEETAYFTTARLVASFFFIVPFALPMALLAQSTGSVEETYAKIRTTIPIGIGLSIGMYVAAAPLAGLLLSFFGPQYSGGDAVAAFRIMTLAGVAFVLKDHYVAVRRVEARLAGASGVVFFGTLVEIILAVLGGYSDGIRGLCWGWTIAVTFEGLVVTPAVLRMVTRRRRAAPGRRAAPRQRPTRVDATAERVTRR